MVKETKYYDLLEISPDATSDQIRQAYRKQSLRWHPDKNINDKANAEQRFKLIAEAYEVLRDEKSRKLYDLHGEQGLKQGFSSEGPGGEYGGYAGHRPFVFRSADEIFREFFGGDPFESLFAGFPFGPSASVFGNSGLFGSSVFSGSPSMAFGGADNFSQPGAPELQKRQSRPYSVSKGQGQQSQPPQGSTMFGPFMSSFSNDPFFSSPMGSMWPDPDSIPANGSFSFMSSSGGIGGNRGGPSTSTMIKFINGQSYKVVTEVDAQGNTTVTKIAPDGTKEITVNGVLQTPKQPQQQQQHKSTYSTPNANAKPSSSTQTKPMQQESKRAPKTPIIIEIDDNSDDEKLNKSSSAAPRANVHSDIRVEPVDRRPAAPKSAAGAASKTAPTGAKPSAVPCYVPPPREPLRTFVPTAAASPPRTAYATASSGPGAQSGAGITRPRPNESYLAENPSMYSTKHSVNGSRDTSAQSGAIRHGQHNHTSTSHRHHYQGQYYHPPQPASVPPYNPARRQHMMPTDNASVAAAAYAQRVPAHPGGYGRPLPKQPSAANYHYHAPPPSQPGHPQNAAPPPHIATPTAAGSTSAHQPMASYASMPNAYYQANNAGQYIPHQPPPTMQCTQPIPPPHPHVSQQQPVPPTRSGASGGLRRGYCGADIRPLPAYSEARSGAATPETCRLADPLAQVKSQRAIFRAQLQSSDGSNR